MEKEKLYVAMSTFAVTPAFSPEYQRKMEESHIPFVLEKGYHAPGFNVFVDTETEPGLELVTYTLAFKDGEAGSNDYQAVRPTCQADFKSTFGVELESGELVPIRQGSGWMTRARS